MYLQNPRDEHRICDSLSLRAHNSYERPTCHLHLSSPHCRCLSHPLLRGQPLQCRSSGNSPPLFLTNLHEESRLDKFQESLSLNPVVLPSKQKNRVPLEGLRASQGLPGRESGMEGNLTKNTVLV
jgi:hypothetical protein